MERYGENRGSMMPDHARLLVSIPPEIRATGFMGHHRRAMMIFERHTDLKYKFKNGNFWTEEY